MRILVVEDRGAVLYPLEDALRSLGHELLTAFGVAQARDVWNSEKDNVDCIIVDLNIPADARAKEAIDEKNRISHNKEWHELAGWIWLEQEGFVQKKTSLAKGAPTVIIYSGYLDVWQKLGCRDSDYPSVKCFRKGPGAATNLLEYIRMIAAKQERP